MPGTIQTIVTPAGETLVVLPIADYEAMVDAAAYTAAKAALASGAEELLTADEVAASLASPTPLAFWRRKRGLTQQAMADALGISQSFVAGLESGDRKGDPALFKRIARALNVRMDDLVED